MGQGKIQAKWASANETMKSQMGKIRAKTATMFKMRKRRAKWAKGKPNGLTVCQMG